MDKIEELIEEYKAVSERGDEILKEIKELKQKNFIERNNLQPGKWYKITDCLSSVYTRFEAISCDTDRILIRYGLEVERMLAGGYSKVFTNQYIDFKSITGIKEVDYSEVEKELSFVIADVEGLRAKS